MSQFLKIESQEAKAEWLTSRNTSSTCMWEDINMEFLLGFPWKQRQNDSIWVVVDRLTKSSHFIPVKSTYLAEE